MTRACIQYSQFKVHMLNGCGQKQFGNEIDYLTSEILRNGGVTKVLVYWSMADGTPHIKHQIIAMAVHRVHMHMFVRVCVSVLYFYVRLDTFLGSNNMAKCMHSGPDFNN